MLGSQIMTHMAKTTAMAQIPDDSLISLVDTYGKIKPSMADSY